jgi:hypothetical protein
MKKVSNKKITQEFLDSRIHPIYGKAKWMLFCEELLPDYDLYLYEARRTFSKYITVKRGDNSFKVRFSNHKPNLERELHKDCDFFVGVTNLGVTTTDKAIDATRQYFDSIIK